MLLDLDLFEQLIDVERAGVSLGPVGARFVVWVAVRLRTVGETVRLPFQEFVGHGTSAGGPLP